MKSLTLVNVNKGFEGGILPLGLCSIAAYLKKYGDIQDIILLDSNCQDIYEDFTPKDIVGISAVSQTLAEAVRFAKFVRTRFPDVAIVLGGVHISTSLDLPDCFDLGVIGEGEQTMLELMRLDSLGIEEIRGVAGICYHMEGGTITNEPRELINSLDTIPLPDRSIANMDFYLKKRQIIPYYSGRSLTIMTSRGCPYTCIFCSTKTHWQKFRGFSSKRVIEEIELLINEYQAEIIHIFDDLFTADRKRFFEIQMAIIDRDLHNRARFMCLARADMLDDQIMGMLKAMNVVVIGVGMESGCEKTLRYLKNSSSASVNSNHRVIELSNKYGIPIMGSFMIGNPGETEGELLQTLDFIKGYRSSPFLAPLTYIATAFPGTEFWEYAVGRGIAVGNYDSIVMDIPDNLTILEHAPLLTDIPRERFFDISQKFANETKYQNVKKYLYSNPCNPINILKAYAAGIIINRSIIQGVLEVTNILVGFIRVSLKYGSRETK
jgi:radical SAM superfamily enzyme YgiQ (UPF0313 family)